MNRQFKILLVFFIVGLGSISHLSAQSVQGTARVFTQPDDAIIRIDGFKIDYGRFIKLDTGWHILRAWSIGREVTEKSFRLRKGEIKTVPVKLKATKEYKRYLYRVNIFRARKIVYRYGPLLAYAFYASVQIDGINRLNNSSEKHYNAAKSHEKNYNSAFWVKDITEHRRLFENSKTSYENDIDELNKKQLNLVIVSGLSAAFAYFTWKRSNKLKRPIFEEAPKMSQLHFFPNLNPNSNGFHLCYNF